MFATSGCMLSQLQPECGVSGWASSLAGEGALGAEGPGSKALEVFPDQVDERVCGKLILSEMNLVISD